MTRPESWSPAEAVATLDPETFDRKSGSWAQSIDLDQARSTLRNYPNRSVWLERAHECVIVGDWRRRPEIASITGIHAVRFRGNLMCAASERARQLGLEAILFIEWTEVLNPAFYESIGFEVLDAVIPLEIHKRHFSGPSRATVPIRRLDAHDPWTLDQLLAIDHAAFDWLWINSQAEFSHVGWSPDVELWGQFAESQLISYLETTHYGRWGHIDRLAVHPNWQGQGLGNDLTRFGVDRLMSHGAGTVGLSTQLDNGRSQRLYEKIGFRRSESNTYRIYGRVFTNR